MSLNSKLAIGLVLAFVGTVAFKVVKARQPKPSDQHNVQQKENTRRFWDVYQLASQKRASGDLDAAAALYQKALALKPDHEDSLYYLGNCHFDRGEYTQASAAYQRLITVNPQGSSRGYMQLGLIHARPEAAAPRDLEIARRYFEKSLQVDPDSGALLCLGEVAILEGKWSQARQFLDRANTDNAMSMAVPYLLGYLRFREGKSQEARKWFGLAVQRGELKKPAVKWTEEGDVKADPELRWRALARQSVFGKYWLPLRRYLKTGLSTPADMKKEYQQFQEALFRAPTPKPVSPGDN